MGMSGYKILNSHEDQILIVEMTKSEVHCSFFTREHPQKSV